MSFCCATDPRRPRAPFGGKTAKISNHGPKWSRLVQVEFSNWTTEPLILLGWSKWSKWSKSFSPYRAYTRARNLFSILYLFSIIFLKDFLCFIENYLDHLDHSIISSI